MTRPDTLTAPELAARVSRLVADAIAEAGGHEDCVPGTYDEQFGVVCGCGQIMDLGIPELDPQSAVPEGPVMSEPELVTAGRDLVRSTVDPITAAIALIDPTQPYGPKEVEEHILDATARLERGMVFEAALVAAAEAQIMEFTLARARAMARQGGGSAKDREAAALLEAEQEYRNMVAAVQARDAIKSTTHTLRSVLSAYQSVAKSVAAAYEANTQITRNRKAF